LAPEQLVLDEDGCTQESSACAVFQLASSIVYLLTLKNPFGDDPTEARRRKIEVSTHTV
jgi:hypothetical protein